MNKNMISCLSLLFFIILNTSFFLLNNMSLFFIFMFDILGIAIALSILNQEKEV